MILSHISVGRDVGELEEAIGASLDDSVSGMDVSRLEVENVET